MIRDCPGRIIKITICLGEMYGLALSLALVRRRSREIFMVLLFFIAAVELMERKRDGPGESEALRIIT